MTDYDDYEDEDDQPQDGNRLVQDLRKQLKAKSKAEKELLEEVAKLRQTSRKTALSELLKGAGVNEKVAFLVPSDVEPTAEAVGEWLKEYGDVFGAGPQGTTSSAGGPEDQEVPPEVQTMNQMQNVAATGEIKGQTRQVSKADLMAASSEEEIWALIRKGAAQGS